MDYSARKINYGSWQVLTQAGLGFGLFLLGFIILFFLKSLFLIGLLFVLGGLIFMAPVFLGSMKYSLNSQELIITRPILHTRKLPYANISEVRKVNSDEAAQIITTYARRKENAGGMNAAMDYVDVSLYSTPGSVVVKIGAQNEFGSTSGPVTVSLKLPPKDITAYTSGDYVLISTTENGRAKKFLLTPRELDEFVAALNLHIEAKKNI